MILTIPTLTIARVIYLYRPSIVHTNDRLSLGVRYIERIEHYLEFVTARNV